MPPPESDGPPPPPAPPPPPPPPLRSYTSSIKLRTGGAAQTKLIAASLEALSKHDPLSDGERPTSRQQVVETAHGAFTYFEHVPPQGAAKFAQQHRILPSTDVTGLKVWPCALQLLDLLAEWLPMLAERRGRPLRILELGAGTGVLGVGIAAVLGRVRAVDLVVLTDPDICVGGGESSLSLLGATVAANATAAPAAIARKLLWGHNPDVASIRDEFGSFDLVLGSELLYREDSVADLAATIEALDVPHAILAQRTRPSGTKALETAFLSHMAGFGFQDYSLRELGLETSIHSFRKPSSDADDAPVAPVAVPT